MDFIRLALERCSTAYDAMQTIIALLEQYGQGGNCGFRNKLYYHNSFLIADHQDAWVLETAGKMWAVEKVKSIRWISNALTISNQWDLASKDLVSYAVDRKWCQSSQDFSFAGCYSDHLYTPLAYGRERHSCGTQLLQKAAGKITPRTMMAILRNHGSKVSRGHPTEASPARIFACMLVLDRSVQANRLDRWFRASKRGTLSIG